MGKAQLLGGPAIFLLLLCLLPGEASPPTTTEPQYLVLVPFLIHTETPEKVCVQLSHLNESVTLSVTLEYGAENKSLIRNIVSDRDVFSCIPFEIPKWNGIAQLFLTVEVKGQTLEFWSRRRVMIKNLESLMFVQTDKPIYKPGQKVLFRIVSLNKDFQPLNETLPLVYIQDPRRNRLFQWQNVELQGGLKELFFPLSTEPPLGHYKVVLEKAPGKTTEKSFEVDEYVLPKFEVTVKVPQTITVIDKELEVTVCGTYTYGKPVPGLVTMNVCRKYPDYESQCYGKESDGICEEFQGEADGRGCFSQVVQTKIFQLKRSGYSMSIDVEGQITEEGTGVTLTGTGFSVITGMLTKVTFEKMDPYYKPGIPFFGQAKLVDSSEAPLANKTIQITVPQVGYKASYTTDTKGIVQFSVDTSNFTESFMSIEAQSIVTSQSPCYDHNWVTVTHQQAYHSMSYFYSPSRSYLYIESVPGTLSCGQTQPVRVHYVLNSDVVKEEDITFYYLVMAKGEIVKTGTHPLLNPGTHPLLFGHGKDKGTFLLDLSVDIHMAPLARLLLYTILPSGELVAHSADFTIENCFANKVELQFSEPEGLPGSKTHLHLGASSVSLCAIHAVDKSVFLLRSRAELSPQTVYDLLPVRTLKGYNYRGNNMEEPDVNPCISMETILVNGVRYSPVASYGEGDAYEILKDFGLKVFSNAKIHKPKLCYQTLYRRGGGFEVEMEEMVFAAAPVAARMNAPPHHEDSIDLVDVESAQPARRFFPETWIWQTQAISSEHEVEIPVTIPDTITEWKAGAFCLSGETGFGLSQPITLNAFQPFFLDLTMPYSVIRGEAFVLKVTVFSYQQHCIRVAISLAPSSDFVASPVEKEEESYCLCANGRKTVSWTVTPKSLGEVNFTASAEALSSDQLCGNELVEIPTKGQKDIVIKPLLVEPEGVEKEVVFSNLLCAAENAQTAPVSLKLPENVVEGSARAFVSILGDIMGTALQNLHKLLKLPYGCGEQNMALFAPNIYVLDYLNKTGQLSEETKSKAIGNLVAGYQRQLNFKHADGSYSTFTHQPGNSWLTAFVLKSFAQAKRMIYIQETHISDALAALAARQKQNGCFISTGQLFHIAIKGGVDDEATLSAYIAIALLEIPLPVTHAVVRNALFCLETAAQAQDLNVYTQALLAYAFSLAGKEDKREQLLRALDGKAVKEEDGSIHWQRPGKQEEENADLSFYRPRAPSAEVEMTAYVLLAHLTKQPAPSQEDLTTASKIVKWLSRQQNPTGGFSSTQDTVVALQGFSLYGVSTFAQSTAGAKVTLKHGGAVLKEFQVESSNRLLLQREPLPSVPGDYSSEVTGEGCVYIQTCLKYNVQPHQEGAPFALHVDTIPETCTSPKASRTFDIAINVSYTGQRPVSNMAIIDVKMLSGYSALKPSVAKLAGAGSAVKRTEVKTSHVLLYLEQVSNVTQSYSFTVEQDVAIQGLKPALVKVYDYYETDEFAMAEYNAPCSTDQTQKGNE
ncbi:alpha-2-macroglobulin-like isoform X3 [Hemicordylus capensis]|uniref:alpha-2-macroglobulin-like isoform X3 n=1 Tax=Hemicordylus capensis TaxID=884348 RepID=UPI0023020BBC|nr:alpha-2-macroglobulin-like isoform X3 [Hemicordylus capensis]